MSDEKTWGVKATPEEFEIADKLFETSGLKTKKDFFPFMLNATKMMLMMEGESIHYKKDLAELQTIKTRIISLFTNMIQTEETIKGELNRQIEELGVQMANIRDECDSEKKDLQEQIQQLQEQLQELERDNKALSEQLESTKLANKNYEDLVGLYKDKIDSLSC